MKIGGIGAIDIENHTAFHLEAKQAIYNAEAEMRILTKTKPRGTSLVHAKHRLLFMVTASILKTPYGALKTKKKMHKSTY